MSQGDADVVRRYLDAMVRRLAGYWEEPRSIVEALEADQLDPDLREVFDRMHPDVRFTNPMGDVFNGRRAIAAGADALLEASRHYSIRVGEIADLGNDTVLAVIGAEMRGKSSGAPASMSIFAVHKLREGLIVEVGEYLSRADALKAVGPAE
jgi:ketosteroid isomerase-like protein